jgi:hypothetical protein
MSRDDNKDDERMQQIRYWKEEFNKYVAGLLMSMHSNSSMLTTAKYDDIMDNLIRKEEALPSKKTRHNIS